MLYTLIYAVLYKVFVKRIFVIAFSLFFSFTNSFLLLYVMCYFKVVTFLSALYFRVLLFRFFPLDECYEDKGAEILTFFEGEKKTGSRTLLRQK